MYMILSSRRDENILKLNEMFKIIIIFKESIEKLQNMIENWKFCGILKYIQQVYTHTQRERETDRQTNSRIDRHNCKMVII